jgi:N-hydroxyarylamine O-acetyltransferase
MGPRELAAYLERIRVERPRRADLGALCAVQWGQTRAIPFENLDILRGEPVRIDPAAVHAKLVERRRGGYCFEQNTLLASALCALGFGVEVLAARVRWKASAPMPRTHILLAVELLDGQRYLVDAGFGGQTPTAPLALAAGSEAQLHCDRYRLSESGSELVLQRLAPEGWIELYGFTLEPQWAIDREMAHHFTATHPSSPFTHTLSVALATDDGRITLRANQWLRRRGAQLEAETIADPEQLLAVLARDFGLVFPRGTRFERAAPGALPPRARAAPGGASGPPLPTHVR